MINLTRSMSALSLNTKGKKRKILKERDEETARVLLNSIEEELCFLRQNNGQVSGEFYTRMTSHLNWLRSFFQSLRYVKLPNVRSDINIYLYVKDTYSPNLTSFYEDLLTSRRILRTLLELDQQPVQQQTTSEVQSAVSIA